MSMELDRELTLATVHSECVTEGCHYCRFAIREDSTTFTCPFYHRIPREWQFKAVKAKRKTDTVELAQEPVQGEDALRAYVKEWENDPVSPAHYQQGARQTLDEMIIMFGIEAVKSFCLCNVYKYKTRAGLKNGHEDLAKADRYLTFYEHLCEYGRVKWDELGE